MGLFRHAVFHTWHNDVSILDLGGQPMIWDNVSQCLNLTILNLPGAALSNAASHHKFLM
jgi:hypothetical protein